jgi:hypothetical protein
MGHDFDLGAGLNAQDDDGLGWSTLADARDRAGVRSGAMRLAGNGQAQAEVRVVAVDEDGQVHFASLRGSVAKNRHLLDRTVA